MSQTQVARLVAYLREHPGATSMDLMRALNVVNTTGRISDARNDGYTIDCRREGGRFRFYLTGEPEDGTLGLFRAS